MEKQQEKDIFKFRIAVELNKIREYKKKYKDKPNEIVLGEDSKLIKIINLYYKSKEDAENFFSKLKQLFKKERWWLNHT